jgi:hypothetical protein
MSYTSDPSSDLGSHLGGNTLGEYYIGLFFSRTVFDRYSVFGRHPSIPGDDLGQSVTSHHESFHSIQDLSTGFCCLINACMVMRDELVVNNLRQAFSQKFPISFPLTDPDNSENDLIDKFCKEILDQYSDYDTTINVLMTGSNNEAGINAIDILEGAAAFYSEIYRRWHIYTENVTPPEEYANIYNFEEIFKEINELPRRYNLAVNYYRKELVSYWPDASDVDVCNLFLLICDLALQVPPPGIISADAGRHPAESETPYQFERYLPGDRFTSIVNHIKRNRLFFSHVPMDDYMISLVVTDKVDAQALEAYSGLVRLKFAKAEEIKQRFHRTPPDDHAEFDAFVNRLCVDLGYETVDSICDDWIEHLQDQIKILYADETLKLRLQYIRARKSSEHTLSSFPNIQRHILGREYPTYCKIQSGTHILCGASDKEGPMIRTIALRMFVRSIISQMLHSGINSCPFIDQTVYQCPIESPQCRHQIDCKDEKFSECAFGRFFNAIFRVPLSEIRCK